MEVTLKCLQLRADTRASFKHQMSEADSELRNETVIRRIRQGSKELTVPDDSLNPKDLINSNHEHQAWMKPWRSSLAIYRNKGTSTSD